MKNVIEKGQRRLPDRGSKIVDTHNLSILLYPSLCQSPDHTPVLQSHGGGPKTCSLCDGALSYGTDVDNGDRS